MAVVTKSVAGRRTLRFETLDDLLADIRQLSSGEVATLGNWSLGQIFMHLAIAFNGSIDGLDLHVPWLVKVVAKTFMRRKFLEKTIPPGFQIAQKDRPTLEPDASTTTEEGLAALEAAIERLKTESDRVDHPVLGPLSIDDWNRFHLRHAEMHLSFAKPV